MVLMPPPLPPRGTLPLSANRDLYTSLRQLRDCPYYWGPLDKDSASEKLANQPDGVFLLRDSSDHHHFFALSFRMYGRAHHVRISFSAGMFSFDNISSPLMKSSSILELIHSTMIKSRNKDVQYFIRSHVQREAPIPVNILYPISRVNVVNSLMHNTRLVIRAHVRFDHIDQLHIPTSLKTYLKDAQYYCEETDTPLPICDITRDPVPPPLPPGRRPPL